MNNRVSSGVSLGIILSIAIFISGFLWLSNYNEAKLERKVSVKTETPPSKAVCSQEEKICPDGSTVSRTGPNCEFAPCPDMTNDDRNVFVNDVYKYEFKYPREATVNEARQQDFGLPANSRLSFEEAYKKYTGKICVNVSYKSGGVNISVPANKDYQYVICGRTGIGSDVKIIPGMEKIKIDGTEYELNFQTLVGKGEESIYGYVVLDDGTQMNFYGSPDMKEELQAILESYRKTE